MGNSSYFLISFLLFVMLNMVNGQPLVPALFIFGDSVVDVGNNNNLKTIVKSNFPPYGRDFQNHTPTGRFCNGKLSTDYTAESLGFTSYPPAYLNLKNAISLTKQLEYYKDCQNILVGIAGMSNASSIVSGSIHLISAGSSDFIQNYYINPFLYKYYTADQFSDILIKNYATFIKNLYALGARRIGVTTLPPIGCLPSAITIFGSDRNECVTSLNNDAINFNTKLNTTSQNLQQLLSGLKLVVLDIYQPLYDLVTKPSENGFFEARKACCGTGLLETSILCNKNSIGTCANATEYVFWDGFHPSEAANKVLADDLLAAGISLIS